MKSIVFDLDDTICFTNHHARDTESKYGKAMPNDKVIKRMRVLKEQSLE